jgi:beta-RFAP synthase
MSGPSRVTVRAPARLHFGVLDLRGERGRRFGGMGAAVPEPALELTVERAPAMAASGPDADRALVFARRYASSTGLEGGAHIQLVRVMPAHSGLGSGTQLALSVATALAHLYGHPTELMTLAAAVGRGERSAVGTWLFGRGGLVLEGGRRGDRGIAPLLARHPLPEAWRAVVAIPAAAPGLSGDDEARAFQGLPKPPEREVERVAHVVLMQLLPALIEADLAEFGRALTEVQRITGGWFAPYQGGAFAQGQTVQLIAELREAGAAGVGQSSWGPTVYALAPDQRSAESLASIARNVVGGRGRVHVGAFSNDGAIVTHDTGAVRRI